MAPNGESMKETAFRGVEALQTIIADRDRLHSEHDRLVTDCALLRQHVMQLEARLESAEGSRDHYMRFATELVTKLNDVQMIIEDSIRGAKVVAFKPPKVPVPKNPEPVDTSGIEKLIRRLPVNGGQDAPQS